MYTNMWKNLFVDGKYNEPDESMNWQANSDKTSNSNEISTPNSSLIAERTFSEEPDHDKTSNGNGISTPN